MSDRCPTCKQLIPTTAQRIGEQISERRKDLAFTQKQLGDLCEMHETAIARLERGKQNMTVTTLEKIAKGLGVDLAYFFLVQS